MLYQITIEEIYEENGKDYPKKVEIYKQQIVNLNVSKLVTAINETGPVPSDIRNGITSTYPLGGVVTTD